MGCGGGALTVGKLFINGGTVLLVNAPAGYAKVLDGSPAKVTTRAGGTADAVLLFATDEAHRQAAVPTTMTSTGPSTIVWTPEACWLS